jgi:hypothetical protein
MDLEGLGSLTLARIAQDVARRRAVMPPMTPASADSWRLSGGRPGPSIPDGLGNRLDRRPERGLAAA